MMLQMMTTMCSSLDQELHLNSYRKITSRLFVKYAIENCQLDSFLSFLPLIVSEERETTATREPKINLHSFIWPVSDDDDYFSYETVRM